MKSVLKIFLLLIVFVFLGITYLLSDYNPLYKNEKFVDMQRLLLWEKRTDNGELDVLIETYQKIYPFRNVSSCFWNLDVLNISGRNTPTWEFGNRYLYDTGYGHLKNKINCLLMILKLEREFSQSDILKVNLQNYDFCFNNHGISEASRFYFKKEIGDLNTTEMVSLIVMSENPAGFNPFRHKTRLDKKVERIIKEHHL